MAESVEAKIIQACSIQRLLEIPFELYQINGLVPMPFCREMHPIFSDYIESGDRYCIATE